MNLAYTEVQETVADINEEITLLYAQVSGNGAWILAYGQLLEWLDENPIMKN